jgi:hypothetical protein
MLGQKVDIFIMAGKRKQLSNDIKNVIVEMRKSGYKIMEQHCKLHSIIVKIVCKAIKMYLLSITILTKTI